MAEDRNVYTPQEFLEKLERDALEFSVPLVGVAGTSDDSDHLMFGDDCATWTSLPIGVLESVTHLDFVACGTHRHPLVEIRLKEPQSEEARAYARLTVSSARRLRRGDDLLKVLAAFVNNGYYPVGSSGINNGGGGPIGGGSPGGRPGFGSSIGIPGGDTYWGVWCPQEGCFVGSIWLYSNQAAQDANAHNLNTGHRAAAVTLST